jgi:putative ABC transport system permease protein
LICAGTAIGVAASLGTKSGFKSQVQGIALTDPSTYGAVVAIFVAVGLLTASLPARRAARVDPLLGTALRRNACHEPE